MLCGLQALESTLFPEANMPVFAQANGPKSKVCDGTITRQLLDWQPKHPSFVGHMRRLGGLDYTPAPKAEAKSALWIPGGDDDDFF